MNIWLDGIHQEKINKTRSDYNKLQKKAKKKSKTKKKSNNGKSTKGA
jgi:hypothetical protein